MTYIVVEQFYIKQNPLWFHCFASGSYEKFQSGFWDEKMAKIMTTSSGAKFEKRSKHRQIQKFDFPAACLPRSRSETLRSRELSQPALSYKREGKISETGPARPTVLMWRGPLIATESVSCCLLIRIARLHMDWNLNKLRQIFQVLMLCLQKSPKNIYYPMVSSPLWNCLIHSLHMPQEHCARPAKGKLSCKYNEPRPQGFSRPTHFLREKPWGWGWSIMTSGKN